jgi:myosin heavy subunit
MIIDKSVNKKLIKKELSGVEEFEVINYEGSVEYYEEKWIMKNMDKLNENVVYIMKEYKDKFVVNIWKDDEIVGMEKKDIKEKKFGDRNRKGMFRKV